MGIHPNGKFDPQPATRNPRGHIFRSHFGHFGVGWIFPYVHALLTKEGSRIGKRRGSVANCGGLGKVFTVRTVKTIVIPRLPSVGGRIRQT